jgi:hypothetical protein
MGNCVTNLLDKTTVTDSNRHRIHQENVGFQADDLLQSLWSEGVLSDHGNVVPLSEYLRKRFSQEAVFG